MTTAEETIPRSKKELGIQENKTIKIKKIKNIEIDKFRSLKNKKFELGDYLTVISGKNGTMKSTLMGLIAHPFESVKGGKDPFGNDLKTKISQVFKLSEKYDKEEYHYHITLELDNNQLLKEPISIYFNKSDNRFRVVASGRNKGDGNFPLNTSYVNLRRLFPMVYTESKPDSSVTYTNREKQFINKFFSKLIQKTSFDNVEAIIDRGIKATLGPANSYYNFEAISSGEDNLGHIVNKLIGFMRYKNDKVELSNGIFCIDEFESSLHPVVQVRLFDFLYDWAKKHNIQIVLSTHSLYLISHVLKKQEELKKHNKLQDISLNMISTAYVEDNNFQIIKNPDYNFAYKELTFKDYTSISKDEIHQINVICEDDVARDFIDKIIKKREIKKYINYITNLSGNPETRGNSYSSLTSLCVNGPRLLENSIVVFDADVPETSLEKIREFNHFIKLPDEDELAIEKRIVKFVVGLPGNHDFFKDFNNEKDKFLSDFSDYEININEQDYKNCSVNPYKRWASSDLNQFKKMITSYVKYNYGFLENWRKKFICLLNRKLKEKSLPPIKE